MKFGGNWEETEWECRLRIRGRDGNINEKNKYEIWTVYNNRGGNMKNLLNSVNDKLGLSEGYNTIIIGDLNARIGEEQGIAEYGMKKSNIPRRKSEDKIRRNEGKQLVNW
uniref:MCT1 protein n=1 Tax=Fopius arisanus TaxID=64838 RepID=A0A0C9Q1K8_9HYME